MSASIKANLKKTIDKNTLNDIKASNGNTKFVIPFLLMVPALIFFTLFTFIPLFKVILDSTHNTNINYLTTYGTVWKDGEWYLSMFNSFVYAIVSVPLTLALALLVSFNISKVIRKNFREFWQTIFFLPYVTSTVAISIVFSQIFSSLDYGIVNWIFGFQIPWLDTAFSSSPVAFVPLVAFGVWHSLAFKVLILTSAMLSIDKRLYDAASIDGASNRDMFFEITLPSLNNTIWYLVTIGLIGSMKVFPLALFDNNISTSMNNMPTMMGYVYECVRNVDYGKAGAASVSLIFVIIVFNYVIKKLIFGVQYLLTESKDNKMKKEINNYKVSQNSHISFDYARNERRLSEINKQIEISSKEIRGGE